MAQMTADEASLIPEEELRPWVKLDPKEHANEITNLEKALVLCTPYKIGPFQSEIDKPMNMDSARERHGLGPVPDRAKLIEEILNEKPPEMARPLGDAYCEYFLKKKGDIPEDRYLEEGWDKEEVSAEEFLLGKKKEIEIGLEDDAEM
eukprot:CAMPEP_0118653470 /NCGR_PEP_ID=MMETSP0785-20121206/11846_1 /TAXON_ID=91992 /ORGANISM="Bolidomonas pacifica, Strain CCMP 1866" /LENGTH=147 /DNA_ID=CAMNT_0006546011 /DNA_START=30 /DNA_END=470 /DNA_ORIENTATION=+